MSAKNKKIAKFSSVNSQKLHFGAVCGNFAFEND
jgi:hypothetical protein